MVIGVTGAIGGGKSVALNALSLCGADVVDSDKLCHKYYENLESQTVKILAERWGKGILFDDGYVNRAAIGEIVFKNPDELKFLTSVIYPELERELCLMIDCTAMQKLLVIEIPLLFEYGWESRVDCTISLWTDRDLRHARLRKRGLNSAEILRRESQQLSAEEKIERANYVLINNGSIDLLNLQCKKIIENIMKGFCLYGRSTK